jgi:uncharacterized membrane-anchored protein
MLKRLTFALLMLACASLMAAPAAPAAEAASAPITAEQFEASLSFQQGKIALPGGIATLDLPPGFRYLSPADAERVLVEGWGNPAGFKSLGMIVPANKSLLSTSGWGVIVTYENDGHVKDDDAETIKYDELLKEMQAGTEENNKARKEQGYAPMTLVGWAEQPSYDKTSHKLYWAKELKTAGDPASGLNYNIRVLGREGVLVLNAVASIGQLDEIRKEMKQVTAFSDFTPGNRYTDFDAKTDKTAEYGIAALVAGGVAAKLGLFGKLFALLLAFKKFAVVIVLAIGAGIGKLLGRKSEAKVSLEK